MEFVTKEEVFYDYVLLRYSPIKEYENKARISNILLHSFEENSLDKEFSTLLSEIRNEIGINQTVWGIKLQNKEIKWEFYFYRIYDKKTVSLKNILKILKKYFKVENLHIDETLPYIMFSFDIDKRKIINTSHIYFEKCFADSFQAWSYQLSSEKVEFENHYEFFKPEKYPEIIKKIYNSPFITRESNILKILYPDLMKCKSICIAAKRNSNGIYFQGIDIKQFLFFLREFNYPQYIIEFLEKNKELLDYILYDVGFDYTIKNGKVTISKSAFYGTF